MLIPIGIFLITLIVSGYFSTIGADPHHDGIMLKPALDMIAGKVLFKESFAQYGILTTIIQALALKIFGSYLITIRLLTAFFYSLISLLLYFIYKRFLPRFLLIVSLFIWLFMAPYYLVTFLPWSSVYSLFFQLLVVYLFILFLENKSFKYFIFGSIVTAIIFWFRQSVGLFTSLAVIVYFIYLFITKRIEKQVLKTYLLYYFSICLSVSFIFILYLFLNHSLNDWFKQSILLLFVWGANYSDGFGFLNFINSMLVIYPLTPSISLIPIWLLLPLSIIILQIIHFKNKILSFVICVSLASWLQYYPITCSRHEYWGATPMIPLFCLLIYQLCGRFTLSQWTIPKNLVKYVTLLIIIFCFFPDISARIYQGLSALNKNYQYVERPRVLKGMKLSIAEAKFYQNLSDEFADYFKRNPKGNIVNNTPDPLYLTFDVRIKNIQPMYASWPIVSNSIYPNFTNTLNTYIKKNRPLVIVYKGKKPQGYCEMENKGYLYFTSLALPCE